MPAVSVITPLHAPGNAFVEETYRSLYAQTVTDWEWLILENHGGHVPAWIAADPRVKVHAAEIEGVGALKRMLCALAASRIVELDADDILVPTALDKIGEAFDGGADFVYSDFAEFQDGTWGAAWDAYPYGARYGWTFYPVERCGHTLLAMHAPPVTAHNLRLIDWCPNHVRAWTREAYDSVGRHDPALHVADDHDLIVRFFLAGKHFAHIPECLYLYRVHAGNTVGTHNAAIRAGTEAVYNLQIHRLAEKWAREHQKLAIDLCGGIGAPPGYVALDKRIPEGVAGVACDLEQRWPLEDGSVGLIRANDAVEHLRDPIHTMNEAWRVLAPGGFLMIHTPSTNGTGAFCDPTHRSFWNRLSFRYYTDPAFARYVPEFTGRFQVGRVIEWFPSDWHRSENVPYVEAHLFAIKDGIRPMGDLLW
jgi:SAM-dependent methyltransferase